VAETAKRDGAGTKAATGERSKERYERRLTQVVDTAASVFAARGYHATTIDHLVEATGLQRGGLYHYIGGKLDLLIAIHERFIEPLLEDARAITARDEAPDVQLRALAHALMGDITGYRDQVTVFLHEWRALEADPAWKGIKRSRREFEDIVTGVLVRGRDEGRFRFNDERLTLMAFLGIFNYSYQWYDAKKDATPDQIADEFTDIFISGIQVT